MNVKIDMNVYRRLEDFCEETGYAKTTAVEKAHIILMNNHETDQEILRRIAEGSVKLVGTGGDEHA